MPTSILTSRSEFIDALAALRRGNVIVRPAADSDIYVLDGVRVLWSFKSLMHYGLITEFDNPVGFAGARYYRITETGRHFADEALAAWQARPLLERITLRLLG